MAVLMFSSAWDDTITFDEAPHIGAGYSYLRKSDFRMNPEHPPLMKDLGGVPLLLMDLQVDWNHPSWMQDPFGQWDFGLLLIYRAGQDANTVTRAAKAPMILFTLLFGWILFVWTRKYFGRGAALLTLFLYTFSPTFLAHGRLVTTDVGAAAGFFVGTVAFLRFLRNPTRRNTVFAGLALGFAFLTKFSTVLLIPIALLLTVAWALLEKNPGHRSFFRFRQPTSGGFTIAFRAPQPVNALWRYLTRTAAIFGLGFLLVYVVYFHHMLKYAPERQQQDTEFVLSLYEVGPLPRRAIVWMTDQPVLRPWAEYFLGLASNVRRAEKGNNFFFLGQIHEAGTSLYFPFVYLVKEPLALQVLTLLALLLALLGQFRRIPAPAVSGVEKPERLREGLREHFTTIAFLVVISIYWWLAVRSTLNIGVRHILPTFPFIYVLVASQMSSFHQQRIRKGAAVWAFRFGLAALLCWQAITILRVHPSYLPYFNELVGGADGGWRYVTDSNVDWGQDLKRLAAFAEQRDIQALHLDYFGSADPAYYLKEKYHKLSSCDEPRTGWVVVSAVAYQGPPWNPDCDYHRWLPMETLVAKIGYSLFVFHLE